MGAVPLLAIGESPGLQATGPPAPVVKDPTVYLGLQLTF